MFRMRWSFPGLLAAHAMASDLKPRSLPGRLPLGFKSPPPHFRVEQDMSAQKKFTFFEPIEHSKMPSSEAFPTSTWDALEIGRHRLSHSLRPEDTVAAGAYIVEAIVLASIIHGTYEYLDQKFFSFCAKLEDSRKYCYQLPSKVSLCLFATFGKVPPPGAYAHDGSTKKLNECFAVFSRPHEKRLRTSHYRKCAGGDWREAQNAQSLANYIKGTASIPARDFILKTQSDLFGLR